MLLVGPIAVELDVDTEVDVEEGTPDMGDWCSLLVSMLSVETRLHPH